jgi:hypothetical protein
MYAWAKTLVLCAIPAGKIWEKVKKKGWSYCRCLTPRNTSWSGACGKQKEFYGSFLFERLVAASAGVLQEDSFLRGRNKEDCKGNMSEGNDATRFGTNASISEIWCCDPDILLSLGAWGKLKSLVHPRIDC